MLADQTPAADFYIHLWDGDQNSGASSTGIQDVDNGNLAVYEYSLYGGTGAADEPSEIPGEDRKSWSGDLIDIDSDPDPDWTLRTDDPTDTDGDADEDLRDQDISLIAVDMDANPGEVVGGVQVYRFVVDGSVAVSGDGGWNRYELLVTRDAARKDMRGIRLYCYEVTYAGRFQSGSNWTTLGFLVPETDDDLVDVQTLDLDCGAFPTASVRLSAGGTHYDNSQTRKSGQQTDGVRWASIVPDHPSDPLCGNIIGLPLNTTGEEGKVWSLDMDPGATNNPFSIRLVDSAGVVLPLYWEPMFVRYGHENPGLHALGGRGLPRSGSPVMEFEIRDAPPLQTALLMLSANPADQQLPFGGPLLVQPPAIFQRIVPVDANGQALLSFDLASQTVGGTGFVQSIATIAGGGVSVSNGLQITLTP